jgi:hypothetical protein
MSQPNNSRGCHTTLDQDSSLIAVVERSQSSCLVAGIVPGISRQPATKLKPDQTARQVEAIFELIWLGQEGPKTLKYRHAGRKRHALLTSKTAFAPLSRRSGQIAVFDFEESLFVQIIGLSAHPAPNHLLAGAGRRRPDRLNLTLVPPRTEGYDAVLYTPRMSIVSLPCCRPRVR